MTDNKDIAIKVSHLVKSFKIPTEAHNGIKQKLINHLRGIKGYRKFTPLNDVSFEIKKGDFFGIVGRNGSGKSTLLKSIANIYSPDSGGVYVGGKLVPFIELGVGFNPELTGRENVFLNGALLGFSNQEMDKMYDEIVDFAELHDFMEEKIKNYSSGMQVRLAFSIAIRAEGDVLLLDEVLAVGDAAFQQKCYDYFEELKHDGRTIILVTHSMDAVKRFCNRALLLEGGKIKLIGSPEEIADQYLLDNIDTGNKGKGGEKPKERSKLTEDVKTLDFTLHGDKSFHRDDTLSFDITYEIASKFNVALAFSIIKNGISVAEMNSLNEELPGTLGEKHKVSFQTSLGSFNPGVYMIDVALINRDNRDLKAYQLKVTDFVVKGNDLTRGGPLYLDGKWSHPSK